MQTRRLIALLAAAVAAGCTSPPPGGGPGGLKVISTVTQVTALARSVGEGRISLTALLTSKDDPHQYELKPDQVTKLGGAKVVLLSGAGADKWMDRGIGAANVQAKAIDLSAGVRLRRGTGSESGVPDPHWWYDVGNAMAAVDEIARAFGNADPGGKAVYEANAAAEKQRLDGADRHIHGLIDPIAAPRRLFVANHDAFNYFLARYDITLVGDIVPSTDSIQAVRPADIAKLVQAIKDHHVCAIFTETSIDPKLAEQIAGEARVKVFDGKLYGDAIGEPGSLGGTLEGALMQNGKLMASAFTSC